MRGDGWALVADAMPRNTRELNADWLNIWSARYGIKNDALLRRTAAAVEGMDSSQVRADDLSIIGAARMKRAPHRGHLDTGRAPFDVLHMDVVSIRKHEVVRTAEGTALSYEYCLVIVDGYSRYPWTYFCRKKSELPGLLKLFFDDVGINRLQAAHFFIHHGGAPHAHLDGDTVLTAEEAVAVMRECGLQACVTSAPHSPAQNGIAERMIQTLLADTRVRMALYGVPPTLWHIAFWHAACARACLASRLCSLNNERVYCTPFELLHKYKPDVRHMVPFWTPCRFMRLGPHEQHRGKVTDLPGVPGRVLGYAAFGIQLKGQIRRMPAYVVYDQESRTIVFVRNVILDERPIVQEMLSAPGVGADMHVPPRARPAPRGQTLAPSAQSAPGAQSPVEHPAPGPQSPVEHPAPGPQRPVEHSAPGPQRPVEQSRRAHPTPGPGGEGGRLRPAPGTKTDFRSSIRADVLTLGQKDTHAPGPQRPVEHTPGAQSPVEHPSLPEEDEGDFVTLESFPEPTVQTEAKRARRSRDVHALEDDDDDPMPELETTPDMEELTELEQPVDLSHDPLRRDRAVRSSTRRPTDARALLAEELAWDTANERELAAEPIPPPYAFAELAEPVALTYKGVPITTPASYAEAMASVHASEWCKAQDSQLDAHDRYGVYREWFVLQHEPLVKSKWVYALKTDEHETEVTRLRARVVGGGYSQVYMRDYVETFSPTSRPEQVRLLLCLAAIELGKLGATLDYNPTVQILCKVDVNEAYLNSELPPGEQLLMAPPPGYRPRKQPPPGYKLALKLLKALPGLKQAGRSWWLKIRAKLLRMGYQACESAPCLFRKRLGSGYIFLLLFVDDGLIVRLGHSDAGAITDLIQALEVDLTLTSRYEVGKFLGAQITPTPKGIFLHLEAYVTSIVERFCPRRYSGDENSYVTSTTPASATINYDRRDESPLDDDLAKRYQVLVGSLMYASTLVRMDIAYVVGELATHMQAPRVCDWEMALRCVQYLAGAKSRGILYPYHHNGNPGLVAFSDSDWAGQIAGRKSRSGWVVCYGGAPISWFSGVQKVVTQSSAEAEYVAVSLAANEVVYLRELLDFLERAEECPTIIFVDNGAAIVWTSHYSADHKRSKHVDVRYHRIRQLQEDNYVIVTKVDTHDNVSDPFTKALPREVFERHMGALMTIIW